MDGREGAQGSAKDGAERFCFLNYGDGAGVGWVVMGGGAGKVFKKFVLFA